MNQLERTAHINAEGISPHLCSKLPLRVKHTSDLRSCLLKASLASLPITIPFLGVAIRLGRQGLRSSLETVTDATRTAKTVSKKEPVRGRPVFTNGIDEADRITSLAQRLRNSQINPQTTHIPEFADDIPKHIELIKEGIKKSGKDVEERLKILDDLTKEALEKTNNQEVTYAWWLVWNKRLANIASGLKKFYDPPNKRNGFF